MPQFMKTSLSLILFLIVGSIYSQSERQDVFGHPTAQEFALEKYDDEPNAAGIILYESGYYYAIPVVKRTSTRLVKEVHRKIKVIDAKKFDYATIDIPFWQGNYLSEEIKDYKAVTHNGEVQSYVLDNSFYKTQRSGVGNVLRFTFPNVQDGSILEYKFTLISPFFYNLSGWEFQNELPTIYSAFKTDLPANYRYNRILYGPKKMDYERATVKKNGFRLPSNSGYVDTELALYIMRDIPSFIQENYTLSKKNYISRIVYEPLAFKAYYGFDQVFTRNWKDVDRRFENDEDFGAQLTKKGYFKRKLPNEILKIKDDLERAKAGYGFIQDRYNWNGRYFNYEIKVKDAFDEKLGSVSAINLSLINALDAAKIDAKAMLLSTRNNELPTELYPVLSNFNYVIAVLSINGKNIFLDATDKQAPFGVIPFRALNVQGRVMDFKKGSYWLPIEPFKQNIHYANAQISANPNGDFTGKVSQLSSGYIGLTKRTAIAENTIDNYTKTQKKDKGGIEIDDYVVEDLKEIEKPIEEQYTISIEPEKAGDKVILYPFFNKTYLNENPFIQETRHYPIDFGYPLTNTYLVSIDVGNVYEIDQLPKSRSIKLPHDDGECSVTYISEGSKVNIRFNLKLNTFHYQPDAYPSLKEFFGTMITMLQEEPITLKKL